MQERDKLVLLLQGITLGAVVATGITIVFLRTRKQPRVGSSAHHDKDRDIHRKSSRSRARSRTRSESPGRRPSQRHSTNLSFLNEVSEDDAGERALTPPHLGRRRSRSDAVPRLSPPIPSTPRIQFIRRDGPTDDEFAVQQRNQGYVQTVVSDSGVGGVSDTVTSFQLGQIGNLPSPNFQDFGRPRNPVIPIHAAYCTNELGKGITTMIERGQAIDEAALQDNYCRVITPEGSLSEENEDVCLRISESLALRDKWLFKVAEHRKPENCPHMKERACPSDVAKYNPFQFVPLPQSKNTFRLIDGVFQVCYNKNSDVKVFSLPGTAADFFAAVHQMMKFTNVPAVKTFCYQRLMLLEQKFNLHIMMNSDKEVATQKRAPHRDFYNVRKIDTHVHHSACMHQKHLLRFIKSKLKREPNEVVIFRDGKYLSLKEMWFLNSGYDLNVDTLDMHADKHIFHRFDKFNLKYNPFGQSRLREIFIKQDNLIHGRFLAELTSEVFDDLKASKYQHAEYRISIYGSKQVEWDILASWICKHRLVCDNVMWLIQIPRLYYVYKESGVVKDFDEMLENIFQPLFEVTHDPATHPQLHVFLRHVVGFDTVDDESRNERKVIPVMPPPKEWNFDQNPPYAYYSFYIYANLYILNKFRESRGLNTFTFRPHCGEAGDVDHLICGFLLSENIAHGINLRKAPSLQYLFYLAQIGLCMSPLSNNSLFLDYHRNPFPLFFARGLSVSLSTDDPLQIHLTREPLVEEYSIAAQVWKLTSTDLCEIARNSVLHSGFPDECKKHWVGDNFWILGPEGNDIHKSNVPNLRLRFRLDTYRDEFQTIGNGIAQRNSRVERNCDVQRIM